MNMPHSENIRNISSIAIRSENHETLERTYFILLKHEVVYSIATYLRLEVLSIYIYISIAASGDKKKVHITMTRNIKTLLKLN